jgi:putative transposase
MVKRTRFSPDVRDRAVRMVHEHASEHTSQWAEIALIASKIGCSAQTLRNWVTCRETDSSQRPGVATEEQARVKAMEREVKELRCTNGMLRKASACICAGGARPPRDAMVAFIDTPRETYGVESIWAVLQAAPSQYYALKARAADARRLTPRAQRDTVLRPEITRLWQANHRVYGAKCASTPAFPRLKRRQVPTATGSGRATLHRSGPSRLELSSAPHSRSR